MSKELIRNRKPSVTIGWDAEGKMHCIALGDAEETLKVFKRERDLDNYAYVAWFRKMKHDKGRATGVKERKMVSIDYSKYDGDAGKKLKEQEEADAAAAAVITDDTPPEGNDEQIPVENESQDEPEVEIPVEEEKQSPPKPKAKKRKQ